MRSSTSPKVHEMHLYDRPFSRFMNGTQCIEQRLNDEKRKAVMVGDEIVFRHVDNSQKFFRAVVVEKYEAASFDELIAQCSFAELGYAEKPLPGKHGMEKYYADAEQKKYGVVGLKVKVLS